MAWRNNTLRVTPGASACGAEALVVTRDNSAAKNNRLLLLLMASPCTGRLRNDAVAIEEFVHIALGLLICQLPRIRLTARRLVTLVRRRHVLLVRRLGSPSGNGHRTDAGNRNSQ